MIRHSVLPKLAECPCFESAGGNSHAASRGTSMDEAFREFFLGNKKPFKKLKEEDADSVMWAINEVRAIAKGNEILTDEKDLKVKTPGIDHIGTEDCRIPAINVSCDLKSGQVRQYAEQQAAYAYGNMAESYDFETGEYTKDIWTCYLLFCDQQKIVAYTWTLAEAKAIVEGVLEAYNDPNKVPSVCDYCKWCAKKSTCSQIAVPLVKTLEYSDSDIKTNLEQLQRHLESDTERLSVFLKQAAIFNSQLVDWAKDLVKEKLQSGESIPGWKLQHQSGRESYGVDALHHIVGSNKMVERDVIEMMGGTVTAPKLQKFCEAKGYDISTIIPDKGEDIVKLVEDKPKKLKVK